MEDQSSTKHTITMSLLQALEWIDLALERGKIDTAQGILGKLIEQVKEQDAQKSVDR